MFSSHIVNCSFDLLKQREITISVDERNSLTCLLFKGIYTQSFIVLIMRPAAFPTYIINNLNYRGLCVCFEERNISSKVRHCGALNLI